ncbi:sensor histidine kinase [Actinoplanes regularis]|uniref:histidine kinase n=1 Tax=Actinoplanes regularis TaxID=52697 RepID=A0A238W4R5_9ACTN|nr:sensor domain-containing protein [Actinoplanes regularis]GIE85269.1 histidine kinase [Actinoplanes regularis]SNR41397.1 Histidine kinase [Actinoplanes regularis]
MTNTLLQAVTGRRFLVSAWPWRGFAYCATTAVASGVLWLLFAVPLAPLFSAVVVLWSGQTGGYLIVAAGLGLVGVGMLALLGPRLALSMARAERWRLRLVGDVSLPPGRRGNLYTDPATWRAVAYTVLLGVGGPMWLGVLGVIGLLALSTPISVEYRISVMDSPAGIVGRAVGGLLLIPVLFYLIALFGGVHAALARLLLVPEPSEELVEVARSRTRMAHAFDAERLRIERDLHDIAQQRLVALTMQIGVARLDLPPSSPAAAAMASAHEQAKTLMAELRDLIRGISPRALRDLGLQAAVEELAAASSLEVHVDIASSRFLAEAESVAYAAISEALANTAKHAATTTEVTVTVRRKADRLLVEVRDGGGGGADPARGSGLTGLADRAAAAGGRLLLSSPAGGPTILRVELPCVS